MTPVPQCAIPTVKCPQSPCPWALTSMTRVHYLNPSVLDVPSTLSSVSRSNLSFPVSHHQCFPSSCFTPSSLTTNVHVLECWCQGILIPAYMSMVCPCPDTDHALHQYLLEGLSTINFMSIVEWLYWRSAWVHVLHAQSLKFNLRIPTNKQKDSIALMTMCADEIKSQKCWMGQEHGQWIGH